MGYLAAIVQDSRPRAGPLDVEAPGAAELEGFEALEAPPQEPWDAGPPGPNRVEAWDARLPGPNRVEVEGVSGERLARSPHPGTPSPVSHIGADFEELGAASHGVFTPRPPLPSPSPPYPGRGGATKLIRSPSLQPSPQGEGAHLS